MKKVMPLIILLFLFAGCNGPLTVTGNPDDHTSTSGTLGSAKFTNRLPEGTGDTTRTPDSIRIIHKKPIN
jgi:hypothetical protein